ncbi:Lsr2 family protein [Nocardioides kongjuensis]|uniref:Lsr2 family protein n=1 Tax=Nocardioides kongjuensis TaxID=349522 RepID=A0A852RQ39_9ACTN|nr:Lsr2 family protein [Nocardioides kongjuensis]NYD32678.1 hypothetical protein [Nocardioides kongjuensis]
MAKHTIVEITDDIDGSQGAEEVAFSFRGTDYTIDLGTKNLAAFEKALKPYLAAASKVGKARSSSTRPTPKKPQKAVDQAAVREWARNAGIDVATRGRIPKSVVDEYNAATR